MQPAPAKRPNSREAILDAASALVLDSGAAHLTLDAVAERAGVSKGGLLYNFPTKEALLQAMIARHVSRCGNAEHRFLADLPDEPGRELKAAILSDLQARDCPEGRRLGVSLIAAGANDPKLLEPVRELQRGRLALLERCVAAGMNPERVALIQLAAKGLFLAEMMGLSPYGEDQRARIVEELLRVVDQEAAGTAGFPRPAGAGSSVETKKN